jgi:hypothetical protein
MSSINQIGTIASGLFLTEFDYLSDQQKSYELLVTSGTLSGKIGELNILLNQNFSFTGSDGEIQPRLQQEEINILEQLYLKEYNEKQARRILRGVYDAGETVDESNSEWLELEEGDTRIKRSADSINNSPKTRIALSKEFKSMADQAAKEIKDLVYQYNMYGSQPRQVDGYEDCEDPVEVTEQEIEEEPENIKFGIIDTEDKIFINLISEPGTIAYGTDTNNMYVWDGSSWYAFKYDVPVYNLQIQDTQENIFSLTDQEIGVIALGTDTQDLYVWDGSEWYIYINS